MNYGALKTLLTGYLHRSDLSTMIPSFIVLAQARMNHDIKHIVLNNTADISATATESDITLPTGCLHVIRIRVPKASGYKSLKQQTLEQNAAVIDSRDGAVGTPKYYAIINSTTAELAPVPEESATLKCTYRKKLTAFSADIDTDDILTEYPNIYVYASMLEATPYINLDKRAGLWKGLYDEEVRKIEDASFEAQWSDSPRAITNPLADTP